MTERIHASSSMTRVVGALGGASCVGCRAVACGTSVAGPMPRVPVVGRPDRGPVAAQSPARQPAKFCPALTRTPARHCSGAECTAGLRRFSPCSWVGTNSRYWGTAPNLRTIGGISNQPSGELQPYADTSCLRALDGRCRSRLAQADQSGCRRAITNPDRLSAYLKDVSSKTGLRPVSPRSAPDRPRHPGVVLS